MDICRAPAGALQISRTFGEYVGEGIVKSGLLGLYTSSILGAFGKSDRYAGQNAFDVTVGPTAATLRDIYSLVGDLRQGKFTDSDKRKMTKMIPYSNLFYLKLLLNKYNEL